MDVPKNTQDSLNRQNKITNEVLHCMDEKPEVINTIKRKLEYIDHMMQISKHHILQVILQKKIDCRRYSGRRRIQVAWLHNHK